MSKKIISLITDLDIIEYVDSAEREKVLEFFQGGKGKYIADFKKLPEKTRILAHLDCIIKFPNHEEIPDDYFPEWCFGSRVDILDKYLILGKDPIEFRAELRELQEKNLAQPIEKIVADIRVKFAFQLLRISQYKFYDAWLKNHGLEWDGDDFEEDCNKIILQTINEYNQKKDKKNER